MTALRTGLLTLAVMITAASATGETTNVLSNGSFGEIAPSLDGWRADYTSTGNKWYKDNHQYVSVVESNNGKRNVLRLHVASKWLTDNPGVKVDSKPVPYERGARYRLTVSGRSTGPNCRILVEGYQWRPGVKPHPSPELDSLRMVYRQGGGRMLYFQEETQGPFSGPSRTWQTATCLFPGDDLSSQARAHLKRVKFISVHIVGISGRVGELFIDDVRLEKVPAPGENP
jgi:hypothetical protein